MKKDIWVGLGIFGLSLLFALDLKDVKNPEIIHTQVGVALFPWLMIVALAILGLFVTGTALFKQRREKTPLQAKTQTGAFQAKYTVPFVMFFILTLYILLAPIIGFYTISFVFFVSMSLLLGGLKVKNITMACVAGIVTVAVVYGIFKIGLQLWMPQGLFF